MAYRNTSNRLESSNPRLFPIIAVIMVSALLVGCGVVTCDQTADRSTNVAAEGINTVRIIAEAGSLDVAGQLNLTEVGPRALPARGTQVTWMTFSSR